MYCIKRLLNLILIFFFVVMTFGGTIATNGITPVFGAEDLTGSSKIEITDFEISDIHGNTPPDGFYSYTQFLLNISWDASALLNNIHEGDYFTIDLPSEFRFKANHSSTSFDVMEPGGTNVVAKAVVTPGPGDRGGSVRLTFTNYVEDRYDIKGELSLMALLMWSHTNTYGDNEFEVKISSKVKKVTIKIKENPQIIDETFVKWYYNESDDEVEWVLRINHKKGNLTNVVITDKLTAESGDLEGIQYDKESFILVEAVMDEKGHTLSEISSTKIGDLISFAPDMRSFTYNMGDITGKQYFLRYKSSYKPDLILKNEATLNANGDKIVKIQIFELQSSAGIGAGELSGKLKIIKIDALNNTKKIKGAKFIISGPSLSPAVTKETDNNGEIFLTKLLPGEYTVKEIFVPGGYILDGTEHKVTVKKNAVAIETIKNNPPSPPPPSPSPKKTSISIKKQWIGKELDSIKVNLFADGKKIASQIVTKAMGWAYEFKDLNKFDGSKLIKYSVTEEKIEGYISKITGDPSSGFQIVNEETPKEDEKPKEKTPPGDDEKIPPGDEGELPKTGDGLGATEYGIALAILGAGLVLIGLSRRRHGKKNS